MKAACCRKGRAGGTLAVLLPGTVWLLMPKCPACLAGYLALFTGLSVSAGIASGLRVFVIFVTICVPLILAFRIRRNYRTAKP